MIDEADKDGDGEVNEAEFLRIMKKTNLYWLMPHISCKISLIIYYIDSYHVMYCLCFLLSCSENFVFVIK